MGPGRAHAGPYGHIWARIGPARAHSDGNDILKISMVFEICPFLTKVWLLYVVYDFMVFERE